jgi:hypothetical protein
MRADIYAAHGKAGTVVLALTCQDGTVYQFACLAVDYAASDNPWSTAVLAIRSRLLRLSVNGPSGSAISPLWRGTEAHERGRAATNPPTLQNPPGN